MKTWEEIKQMSSIEIAEFTIDKYEGKFGFYGITTSNVIRLNVAQYERSMKTAPIELINAIDCLMFIHHHIVNNII